MTTDRLERRLPEVLTELSLPRVPDYVDDLLVRTARTPQRPGWTYLERWLPMSTFTATLSRGGRLPLRPLIAVALLIVALIAALLVVAGSQKHLPPLFGLARNGAVVTADAAGNIVAVEPESGSTRTLVSGPNLCCVTVAPNGQAFAFSHVPLGGGEPTGLTIKTFDGALVRDIPAEIANASWYEWSPTSDRILLTRATGADILDLASGQLTSISPNADRFEVIRARWIGATGDILFIQRIAETQQTGLTAKFLRLSAGATTGARELGTAQHFISEAGVSPDGSKFLYFIWGPEVRLQGKLHVLDLATGADRAVTPEVDVPAADITEWENPVWSPDGSHIAAELYTAGPNHVVVIPATGGDPVLVGPEFPTSTGGTVIRFSPDGTSLLVTYKFNNQTWLVPATGGQGRQVPWATGEDIDWQRLGQ